MAKKKTRRPGGGGRSTRYTAEGARAADEGFESDVRRGRYAVNSESASNLTLQEDLNQKAAQATDATRQRELAEVLAQVALEYNRSPTSTQPALDVYSEAIDSLGDAETARQLLAQADAIARQSQTIPEGGQMPSQLFKPKSSETVADAAAQEQAAPVVEEVPEQGPPTQQDAIREALKALPNVQEVGAQSPSVVLPLPLSSAPPMAIPTAQGMAYATGEPFADAERAASVLKGLDMSGLAKSQGQDPRVFSRVERSPLFQNFVVDINANQPVTSTDPTGELSQRPYTDPYTDELFYGSQNLLGNLGEYPLKVETPGGYKTDVSMFDRVALRRAQDTHDKFRQAFFDHVDAGGDPEKFYDTPAAQALTAEYQRMAARLEPDSDTAMPRANFLTSTLLGTEDMGARPRGATTLERAGNPYATYNPLIASMAGDTLDERGANFNARYGGKVGSADKALLSTLFSPNQYGIRIDQRPQGELNRAPGMRGLGLSRYEGGLVATNNLVEALNRAAAARNLNLQYALTNPNTIRDPSAATQMGIDMRSALDEYFKRTEYNRLPFDVSKENAGFALDALARGMLETQLRGTNPESLPTGVIPVPTPQEFIFGRKTGGTTQPARPYTRIRNEKMRDRAVDNAMRASLSQEDRNFDFLSRVFSEDASTSGEPIYPYYMFPQAARPFGVYFDPFAEAMGGAYVEGTSPTLPPELAAELFANAMGIEPSAFRQRVVEGLVEGLDTYDVFSPPGKLEPSRKGINAAMSSVAMPKQGLLTGLRNLPQRVVPNAAETVRRAVEAAESGAMPMPKVAPSASGYDGSGMKPAVMPQDNDTSYLPSLYNAATMFAAQNRMARPMRRGVLANLVTV